MASKLGGHSLIRDPPLRKVGGPLTPRTPRIAATGRLGAHSLQPVGLPSTSSFYFFFVLALCAGTKPAISQLLSARDGIVA